MHLKANCVCFIYMQPLKVKFKSVQINMKQVSYIEKKTRHIWVSKGNPKGIDHASYQEYKGSK